MPLDDEPAPGGAAAPKAIGRRDRSAYRVGHAAPASEGPEALAPHLTRLTDDWAMWRTVCLRGAGFPLRLLSVLGDTALADAADAVLAADTALAADAVPAAGSATDPPTRDRARAAYADEFAAAIRRQSTALFEAAGQPAIREAVAWQNRHALETGLDSLLRQGRAPARRNGQHRK